jgi:phospholipid-translocating ATPase
LFTIVFFRDSFTNIVTITFTALILIECLNVYTQIHNYDFPMMMLQVATITVYFMSILFMKQYFDVSYMDEIFFVKVFAIVAVTWLPMHMLYFLLDYLDPSEHRRVMEHMYMKD